MKICFLTFSRARNYGAVLQTYATYRYLKSLGNEVTLVDYLTERYDIYKPDYPKTFLSRSHKWGKNIFTRFIWKNVIYKNVLKSHKLFWDFIEKNIPISPTFYNETELKDFCKDFDCAISGSDQIWNTDFTKDNKPDRPYFLSFADKGMKKLAYSSSFGKATLEDTEKGEIEELLSEYDRIFVREKSGKEIVEDLGLKAEVILDPTLICDKKIWEELAGDRIYAKPYLLLFQIFPNGRRLKLAEKVAKQKGLKLIVVAPYSMDKYKIKHKVVCLPEISEWLSYFKYADFIMTDSFHATAFSVIFERDFAVDANVSYNGRMKTLLDSLDLSERMYENTLSADILDKGIDYSEVSGKLAVIQERSRTYINDALK